MHGGAQRGEHKGCRDPHKRARHYAALDRGAVVALIKRLLRHAAFVEQVHHRRPDHELRHVRIALDDRLQHVVGALRVARGDAQRKDVGII